MSWDLAFSFENHARPSNVHNSKRTVGNIELLGLTVYSLSLSILASFLSVSLILREMQYKKGIKRHFIKKDTATSRSKRHEVILNRVCASALSCTLFDLLCILSRDLKRKTRQEMRRRSLLVERPFEWNSLLKELR